jgi:hypothetical protein
MPVQHHPDMLPLGMVFDPTGQPNIPCAMIDRIQSIVRSGELTDPHPKKSEGAATVNRPPLSDPVRLSRQLEQIVSMVAIPASIAFPLGSPADASRHSCSTPRTAEKATDPELSKGLPGCRNRKDSREPGVK